MTKRITAGIVLSVLVIAALYLADMRTPVSVPDAAAQPSPNSSPLSGIGNPGQRKAWVCPMHPGIMQDHPGTCPICGMDLVEADGHAGHGIHADPATLNRLGARLAPVRRTVISREIRTYGNVTADGNAVYDIHSNFDGWIQKSHIHSIGQKIAQGQVIYEIYSPELIMQQKEYLRFLERRNQILQTVGDVRFQENEYVMNLLTELSRERSKFLYENVSLESVQRFEDSKMPIDVAKIVAAESGVVTRINARAGTLVTPSETLFTLANVARVWVDITLYPDQASQVKAGDEVSIKVAHGESVKARLEQVNPVAENNKVIARASLSNAGGHLKPGTFADVLIHAQPHEALVLPRSAVIYTGAGNMVMMSRGDGHFLPVPVETGVESGDEVEIVEGLLEGAEVAVNGQFLLDSAASMNAAVERMRGHHD